MKIGFHAGVILMLEAQFTLDASGSILDLTIGSLFSDTSESGAVKGVTRLARNTGLHIGGEGTSRAVGGGAGSGGARLSVSGRSHSIGATNAEVVGDRKTVGD